MGVYIKGMEMPTSGTYEVSIDNSYGKDKTVMSLFVRGDGGLICCGCYEIVPVPPHGDLIDRREAIIDANERAYDFWLSDDETNATIQFLNEQTTIIPAEEGE